MYIFIIKIIFLRYAIEMKTENITHCHIHALYHVACFQIYRKCLDCVCTLLPQVLSSSSFSEISPFKSDPCQIRDLVQRNFCSMEWEFRDTSCEFVRNLLEKHKGKKGITISISNYYLL
jgi:hypothetical protein